jgi:4-amino-4-deoxy-L-arabinose transferase-like glycosyltransferase
MTVLIVAAVVRVFAVGNLALIIHNDGIDYLNGAMPIYHSLDFSSVNPFRTPGYPIVIAASYWLFGISAVGLLLVQHGLGMFTSLCVTGIAGRYVKPKWAMVPGLLVALDPQVFAVSSLLETEWAVILLFALAVLLVVRVQSRPVLYSVLAGAAIGFACLVRPTFQVTLPFLLLAVICQPRINWRRRTVLGMSFALAVGVFCAPWFMYNARRDVAGLSNGFGPALWTSLCQQDLLDRNYPLPPDEAERYAPVALKHGASDEMWEFMRPLRDDPEYINFRTQLTKRWALESIKANFPAYAARLPWSLAWQMNLYPDGGAIDRSQLRWYFWMLSTDIDDHQRVNTNFFFDGSVVDAYPLSQSGLDGPMRAFIGWWGIHYPGGIPQIPLCALALATGVLALWKKDWILAWTLLGSAAFVGVHVFMVFHQSRYSLPATVMWYGVALVPFAMVFPRMRSVEWPWASRPATDNAPAEVVAAVEPKTERRAIEV